MNELINQQRAMNSLLDIKGWSQPYPLAVAGSSRGSMEDALPKRHAPHHQDQTKRRRLSRLLDKLAVQLNNNNNYPRPSWLTVNRQLPPAKYDPENAEEAPLDLSIKPVKAPTPEPSFICNYCGQSFSVHDRLSKHIASRHRSKPDAVRTYECEICLRKFARSDMLTRHARLHSGVKPYCCNACGQVFSRSDHLATHQRTHTGEKPYKCPTCSYAACRRDMITRHMRTHTRRTQPV